MIETFQDKYDGVIVDSTSIPLNENQFKKEMEQLISTSTHKKLIWIKLAIEKSNLVPILTHLDFEFHHCDEKNLMLVKKVTDTSIVPTTKNYIVAVGAVVFHQGKLLVIKDRFSTGYKLPGGHIDKNESIKDALVREVYEETGVHVHFQSIMNLGHFKNGQFGESNLYIVCTAIALSSSININDADEIAEATWISPQDFLNDADVNNYNKSVVSAAINNKELKLIDQHVELKTTTGEVFF